jgi:hypothetical protein
MGRNLWLYLLVVAVSCGVGYIAVFLPGSMSGGEQPVRESLLESEQVREFIGSLSEEEKQGLKEKLGIGSDQ